VYLKVSPMKGVQRFGIKRKLAPRYVGPFKILKRKGEVAYKLQLPESMNKIFPVFHVSQLNKCLRVPEERIEALDLRIRSDLVYQEQPVRVMDTKDRVTRNKVVRTYKVQWSHHDERDATWETENYLREVYPNFYKQWLVTLNLGTRFL